MQNLRDSPFEVISPLSCNCGKYGIVEKMESEVSRVTKLKSIWKFQVRVLLNSHGALEFALGTDVKPADLAATAHGATRAAHVKEVEKWNKSDAAVQKIIVTTIEDQPTLHIINGAGDVAETLLDL